MDLLGEGDRAVAGVLGRDLRKLEAGRAGGPIMPSRVVTLEPRLRTGECEGDMLARVSTVLSVSEGLGLRRPRLNSAGLLNSCSD